MVEISDSLQLLFETMLEDDGDRYVIPVSKELVADGSLSVDDSYRIALLSARNRQSDAEPDLESAGSDRSRTAESDAVQSASGQQTQGPPVEEGEVRSVTIDTLGDQGDGIAKVERGFIVIVSDTQPGDQVDVEITDVKETVAFAEPVSEPTVR